MEHRASPRKRSLLGGRVLLNRSSVLTCTIRDLSRTGAKLVFPAPTVVPDEFDLEIQQPGQRMRAQVMWRKGASCGVKFLSGPSA